MDRADFVRKRRGKYMAQVLEHFEREIEPLLPSEAAGAVQDFKAMVRARFNALATDAIEVQDIGTEINGAAQVLRDELSPVGRP